MSFERIEGNWMHRCKAGEDRPGHASECPNCAPQAVPSSPAAMGRDPRIKQFWADVKECPDCKGPNGDYCGDHFERAKKLAAMVEAPAPPSGETGEAVPYPDPDWPEDKVDGWNAAWAEIRKRKVTGSEASPPASRQEIREAQERAERFERALDNIRSRCFDDSEWARYIDLVKGMRQKLDDTPAVSLTSEASAVSPSGEPSNLPESRPPAPGSGELEERMNQAIERIREAMRQGRAIPYGPTSDLLLALRRQSVEVEQDAKTIRESLDVLEWGQDAAYMALERIVALARGSTPKQAGEGGA